MVDILSSPIHGSQSVIIGIHHDVKRVNGKDCGICQGRSYRHNTVFLHVLILRPLNKVIPSIRYCVNICGDIIFIIACSERAAKTVIIGDYLKVAFRSGYRLNKREVLPIVCSLIEIYTLGMHKKSPRIIKSWISRTRWRCHSPTRYVRQVRTVSECVATYAFHAVWQSNGSQPDAVEKGFLANGGYAIRYVYRRQTLAVIESTKPYLRHTVRYIHVRQRRTAIKSIITNCGDNLWQNNGGQRRTTLKSTVFNSFHIDRYRNATQACAVIEGTSTHARDIRGQSQTAQTRTSIESKLTNIRD